jgi:hypothetical protein
MYIKVYIKYPAKDYTVANRRVRGLGNAQIITLETQTGLSFEFRVFYLQYLQFIQK